MSEKVDGDYSREVRDTVVKSSLTGVGITVLAVTVFSPAGFGGMIGTSMASAFGSGHTDASGDPYANLPPYPAPLTQSEISDIRGQLAATAASLEITRAATDDKIEYIHALAEHPGALAPPPAAHFAKTNAAPHAARVEVAEAAPVAATPASDAAPVEAAAAEPAIAEASAEPLAVVSPAPIAPVSYSSVDPELRDSHLEFASLLLGTE